MAAANLPPLPPLSFPPRGRKAAPDATAPVRRELAAVRKSVLDQMTPNNLGQVKMLHASLFPVVYSEQFYQEALWPHVRGLNKIAYFNDLPVGNIICRYEPAGADKVKVYIMTLGVLAPYRRLGLASQLLKNVLETAAPGTKVTIPEPQAPESKGQAKEYEIESVYLNMQTNNVDARTFYEKNGFNMIQEIPAYYHEGIEPRSAWVLELTK